jgi:hypothetical protein
MWWTKWYWGVFSPSISFPLSSSYFTNCFIFILSCDAIISILTASLSSEIKENMDVKRKVVSPELYMVSFLFTFIKVLITYAKQYVQNSVFENQFWFGSASFSLTAEQRIFLFYYLFTWIFTLHIHNSITISNTEKYKTHACACHLNFLKNLNNNFSYCYDFMELL